MLKAIQENIELILGIFAALGITSGGLLVYGKKLLAKFWRPIEIQRIRTANGFKISIANISRKALKDVKVTWTVCIFKYKISLKHNKLSPHLDTKTLGLRREIAYEELKSMYSGDIKTDEHVKEIQIEPQIITALSTHPNCLLKLELTAKNRINGIIKYYEYVLDKNTELMQTKSSQKRGKK